MPSCKIRNFDDCNLKGLKVTSVTALLPGGPGGLELVL